MRRSEQDLLEGLVRDWASMRLEAVLVEHVDDALAEAPMDLLSFTVHCSSLASRAGLAGVT